MSIYLLHQNNPLHTQVKAYFQYFLEQKFEIWISTVSIAEYGVRGSIEDLPILKMKILNFEFSHAKRAAEIAKYLFSLKKNGEIDFSRLIIQNDTKLFAQADAENFDFFATADIRAMHVIQKLKASLNVKFEVIDINIPHTTVFNA